MTMTNTTINNMICIVAACSIVGTLLSVAFQRSAPSHASGMMGIPPSLKTVVRDGVTSTQQIDPVEYETRYLTRSAPFQIQSKTKLLTPAGEEIDVCIEIEEAGVESNLIIQECSDDNKSQQWLVDQFGRFHSNTNRDLCISIIGGKVKKCNFNSRNALSIDAFSDSIIVRKNGGRSVSYYPDAEEVLGSSVSTRGSASLWDIKPSNLFQSKDDLPLDKFLIKFKADRSKCVVASSLTRLSPLVIESCDPNNNKHLWKFEGGKIQIENRKTKCIVKGSPFRNGDPELYIGTPCRQASQNKGFVYDAVTYKIVHERNNFNAFTVEGDDVVLSYNKPKNNAAQQFILEAP